MRLSGRLQLAPTPRVIRQLGMVERFAGEWTRIGKAGIFDAELEGEATLAGTAAALALDSTAPPGISTFLITISKSPGMPGENGVHFASTAGELAAGRNGGAPGVHFGSEEIPANRHLDQGRLAYAGSLPLTLESILSLYALAAANEPLAPGSSPFRRDAENFRAPALAAGNLAAGTDELVFPTVSPFLVEQRLAELLGWAETELRTGAYHPLLIAPLFHILFLQIHPFPRANHRLSLAILWHILAENGFSFVRFQHLAPLFEARSKAYFSALKQAEKTAGTNWSTMNVWFELFFDTCLELTRNLRELSETLLDESRLSDVQRRIIDVVRARGTAARETIAHETGIHTSTVKYNLGLLSDRGHLKRDGGGRGTHYRIG